VLDADIEGAFDHISHEHPACYHWKSSWYRTRSHNGGTAGYVEKGVFHETQAGTPQGGVMSPVLANIALHGMEEALEMKHYTRADLNSTRAIGR
jgi:RNA-directed DNA polymerase